MTDADKKRIDEAVDAVVEQYGKVFEWLGMSDEDAEKDIARWKAEQKAASV